LVCEARGTVFDNRALMARVWPDRIDQRDQHIEGAPELDRQAVGGQLAAMRQHPETTERDARRCFGEMSHQLH
jgi:hypothetical protein